MKAARTPLARTALNLCLSLTSAAALTAAGTLWPVQAADPDLLAQVADPDLPAQAADPILPAQAADPILPAQAADPILPAQAADPVLAAQAADPVLPAQGADPVLPAQGADPALPAQAADPVLAAQAADAALAAQAADPVLLAQAADSVLPAQAADPMLPAQAADPAPPAHAPDPALLALALDPAPPAHAAAPPPQAQAAHPPLPAQAADPDPEGRSEEIWMAVNDGKLDTLRGGFDAGNGLLVSFGITRAVYINGNLVTQTTLDFGHLTDLTAAQAAQLSKQLASLNIVQNGPGNTVQAQQGGVNFGTIIQNSLSNQHIENQTIINASSNSMGTLKNLNSLSTLNDSLLSAVGAR
jgi:hypothetical protein